jgi:Phosphate-selective porin O and P
MKRSSVLSALALALLAQVPAMAQAPKVSGLLQVWYTQMLDNSLRLNSNALATGAGNRSYYNLRSEFRENTFAIRRAEIKLSGEILEGVKYEVMIDPSINTSTANPTILQDAAIIYGPGAGFEFKIGQFKNFQTYEGLMSSSEILFAERAQMTRVFGDNRDRGVSASWTFGEARGLVGTFTLAAFNGGSATVNSAATATTFGITKANDTNAQKDFVARAEFAYAGTHKFGVYTLQGVTDYADKATTPLVARTFTGAAPAPAADQIVANKDKTTNLGAFYVYQDSSWFGSVEYINGLLGRRNPTVINGTVAAAVREHLDQKFLGYAVTAAYTFGNHTVGLRYDLLNYNQGDKWYTNFNPYKETAPGTPIAINGGPVDYTPKYTEITVGYRYAFKPELVKAANIKLNYIARSKNFLAPLATPGSTQTGEQGGNSFVAAFQVAF